MNADYCTSSALLHGLCRQNSNMDLDLAVERSFKIHCNQLAIFQPAIYMLCI